MAQEKEKVRIMSSQGEMYAAFLLQLAVRTFYERKSHIDPRTLQRNAFDTGVPTSLGPFYRQTNAAASRNCSSSLCRTVLLGGPRYAGTNRWSPMYESISTYKRGYRWG
jgi:hypothetical protein